MYTSIDIMYNNKIISHIDDINNISKDEIIALLSFGYMLVPRL
jgi:hypothetical protein